MLVSFWEYPSHIALCINSICVMLMSFGVDVYDWKNTHFFNTSKKIYKSAIVSDVKKYEQFVGTEA